MMQVKCLGIPFHFRTKWCNLGVKLKRERIFLGEVGKGEWGAIRIQVGTYLCVTLGNLL